ncbi:hypothetical protein NESM_000664100 [Novymonas esmeraldas]
MGATGAYVDPYGFDGCMGVPRPQSASAALRGGCVPRSVYGHCAYSPSVCYGAPNRAAAPLVYPQPPRQPQLVGPLGPAHAAEPLRFSSVHERAAADVAGVGPGVEEASSGPVYGPSPAARRYLQLQQQQQHPQTYRPPFDIA